MSVLNHDIINRYSDEFKVYLMLIYYFENKELETQIKVSFGRVFNCY